MSNLTLTNLTANNVSITGDAGKPRISLSSAVGANTATLNSQLCLGNVELCDALATLITASKIAVTDAASNTLTAAQIESFKAGTYWDKDDDSLLDYSEAGVIHATTLKAVPVGADEIRLEDSAASWAVKRATVTSVATAAAALNPSISTADGTVTALANKAAPIAADVLLIEDSAAAGEQKNVTITDLNTVFVSTADGTVTALANKAAPIAADVLLIEDSAAAGEQKNVTITDLATAVASISPPGQARVVVTGLIVDTLNDEQSTAMTNGAANEFVPTFAIVHMEDVGVGAAAAGDFEITIGTASGGTQILAATACTGVIGLNTKLVIGLDTIVQPAIAGDATIYVKVTSADSTAGAAHLADVYLVGQTFVSGT